MSRPAVPLFLVLALLSFPGALCQADELLKKDGSWLRGTVLAWSPEAVVFVTGRGELFFVPPAEIETLVLAEQSIETVSERLPAAEPEPIWQGRTDASYSGKRGTRDSDSLVLDFEARRRTGRHRLRTGARYFYSTQEETVTGDQLLGSARLDRFFSSRFFLFGSVDAETNRVEGIDLRSTAATGFGLEVARSPRGSLSLSGGAGYTAENFTDGTARSSASGLFTEELRYRLSRRTELEQLLRYLQDLGAAARFKLRLEGSLRVDANEFLSFRVALVNAYDNRPPAGARRNELTFLTGLGFSF